MASSSLSADLRKRIEIMAEHIARNGAEFEQTVRQKNMSNPQFAFLYGGEGSDYYAQALASHRGGGGAAEGAPNGSAGEPDLGELLRRWREPPAHSLAPEVEQELYQVVASLEEMASRDAVRNGRQWIEANTAIATQIAGQMMRQIHNLTAPHRLHVLYLVHDLLQTEGVGRDPQRPLIRAFKPYLPWLMRPAYQLARSTSQSGEEASRVLRLLQLWVERSILLQQEAQEIQKLITAAELPSGMAAQQPAPQPTRALPRPVPPRPTSVGGMAQMGGAAMGGMGARPYGNTVPPPGGAYANAFGGGGPRGVGMMGYPAAMQMAAGVPGMYMRPFGAPMGGGCGGGGGMTPETVPVGLMATMLKHFISQAKNSRADFVRYKPMDPSHTPQMLPPMQPLTQRMQETIEDFYEDLKDDDRSSSSSRSSRSSSRSRSRSRGRPARNSSFSSVPPPMDSALVT
eukprot:TRINITY_DN19410_c0_g2_i1.p2 TRINITY_DN19410_c0_g2~~TRINITY_DN19410_c0_g2_i1.p2  ORF type:complete len:491 (+),score=109.77 TRINITY_DN19410_c0_g2_i1:104-1474(+)